MQMILAKYFRLMIIYYDRVAACAFFRNFFFSRIRFALLRLFSHIGNKIRDNAFITFQIDMLMICLSDDPFR